MLQYISCFIGYSYRKQTYCSFKTRLSWTHHHAIQSRLSQSLILWCTCIDGFVTILHNIQITTQDYLYLWIISEYFTFAATHPHNRHRLRSILHRSIWHGRVTKHSRTTGQPPRSPAHHTRTIHHWTIHGPGLHGVWQWTTAQETWRHGWIGK